MINTKTMAFDIEFQSKFVDSYNIQIQQRYDDYDNPGQTIRENLMGMLRIEVIKSKILSRHYPDANQMKKQKKKFSKVTRRFDYYKLNEDFYDLSGKVLFSKGEVVLKPAGGQGLVIKLKPMNNPDDFEVYVRTSSEDHRYNHLSIDELNGLTKAINIINQQYKSEELKDVVEQ